jgi:7-cyano-7-deazaguanine reductase
MITTEFKALGNSGISASKNLEVFPTPSGVDRVTFETDGYSFTSRCPVTHQPDYYHIKIVFFPGNFCLESKSLKLYLETFREEGIFAEALSATIRKDIETVLFPKQITVTVRQMPRGGLTLESVSEAVDWEKS